MNYFKRYSPAFHASILWMGLILIVAIIQPWVTTPEPWYCTSQPKETTNTDGCIDPFRSPIPFDPSEIRLKDRLSPPMTLTIEDNPRLHVFGTDNLGRDVAAGLTYGLRQALIIGFGSMTLCILFGFFLGALSAWYGDLSIRWSPLGSIARWISLVYTLLFTGYLIHLMTSSSVDGTILAILWAIAWFPAILIWTGVHYKEQRMPLHKLRWALPFDQLINRFIEIFQSLPALLLLLAITVVIGKHTTWTLMLVLFFIRWPLAARFIRAEVLNLREKAFLEHVNHNNPGIFKILFREILPNTYVILIALFAFGVSTAILLEATLTFLGLGLPLEQVSWGSLILHGRQNPQAWWLILFPGLMILFTLLSLLIIGEEIQRKRGQGGDKVRFL